MASIDVRVTVLERQMDELRGVLDNEKNAAASREAEAKAHFGELRQVLSEQLEQQDGRLRQVVAEQLEQQDGRLRQVVAEQVALVARQVGRLEWRIGWLVLPALATIAAAVAALAIRL